MILAVLVLAYKSTLISGLSKPESTLCFLSFNIENHSLFAGQDPSLYQFMPVEMFNPNNYLATVSLLQLTLVPSVSQVLFRLEKKMHPFF